MPRPATPRSCCSGRPDGAELTVSDDGQGFDIQVRNHRHGPRAGEHHRTGTAGRGNRQHRDGREEGDPGTGPRPDRIPDGGRGSRVRTVRRSGLTRRRRSRLVPSDAAAAAETCSPYPVIDGFHRRPAAGRLDSFVFPAVPATRGAHQLACSLPWSAQDVATKGSSMTTWRRRSLRVMLLAAVAAATAGRDRSTAAAQVDERRRIAHRGAEVSRGPLGSGIVRSASARQAADHAEGLRGAELRRLRQPHHGDSRRPGLVGSAPGRGHRDPRRRHLDRGAHRHRPAEPAR